MIFEHTGETHMTTTLAQELTARNSFTRKLIVRGEGNLLCTTQGDRLRSNRPVTEFACKHLGFFLTGHYKTSGKRSNANTVLVYEIEEHVQSFKVNLYGEEILSILLSDWKPVSVLVSFTDFYDRLGQPTITTAERLNGLLDRLGAYGVLPKGTRVFRDPSQGLTYLGKGDNKIAVGRDYAEFVYLRPSAKELDIVGSIIAHEVK